MKRISRSVALISQALAVAVGTPALSAYAAQGALEEVIVSARKTDETLQTVPIAVSAFSENDLTAMNIVQTSDVGRFTPSVFIEQGAVASGSGAKVTIRGQQQSDSLITLDPSVGWYLDDVYLARAYGTVASLFDAQRIEVLKGPQGTLYGRNTTGGAIKIVSKKAEPSDDVGGFLIGGIGNYNARKLGGALNIPLIDNVLGVRITALKDMADGYGNAEIHDIANPLQINDRKDVGDRDTEMYRLNLTWLAADNFDVQFGYEHSKLDMTAIQRNIGPLGDGFGVVPSSTNFYDVKVNILPRSVAKADTVNLTLNYEISDDLNSKLIYGWRRVDSRFNSDIDGSALGLNNFLTPFQQWAKQESYEWQIAGTAMNDQLDWITGLYYFEEHGYDQTQVYGVFTGGLLSTAYGSATNTSQSTFVNGTLHLTEKLNFTGGLRYTKDSKPLFKRQPTLNLVTGATGCNLDASAPKFDATGCSSSVKADYEFISWTAGFDYTIAEDVMAYIKGSKASRSGGQNARGVDAFTSEPFAPETATDIEIGIKSQFFDNRVRLNADVYHTFYEDVQQSQLLQTSRALVTKVVNAAKGSVDGFEFELTALLLDNLTLTTTGSLLNWKFDDPNSLLSSAPEQQYSVRLDYTLPVPVGALDFSANYSYRGEYFANVSRPVVRAFDEATIDSVGLFNGRISLNLADWNTDIALWGNNLTGEKYATTGLIIQALSIATSGIGEPRTYGIEVTKRF